MKSQKSIIRTFASDAYLVLLFSALFPLHVWSVNASDFVASVVIRPWLVLATINGTLLLFLTVISGRKLQSFVWVALINLYFFFAGEGWGSAVEYLLPCCSLKGMGISDLALAWSTLAWLTFIAVLLCRAIVRLTGKFKTSEVRRWIFNFLHVFMATILLQAFFNTQSGALKDFKFNAVETSQQDSLPDVYYIVLDMYSRQDVFAKWMGYDNSDFTNYLKSLGFHVYDNSYANYILTQVSVPSILNFDYIQNVINIPGKNSKNRAPLHKALLENRAFSVFEANGYQTVAFQSAYSLIGRVDTANRFIPFPNWTKYKAEFIENLLAASIIDKHEFLEELAPQVKDKGNEEEAEESLFSKIYAFIVPNNHQNDSFHINSLKYQLRKLPSIPSEGKPRFVFTHILSPHSPYILKAPIPPENMVNVSRQVKKLISKRVTRKRLKRHLSQVVALNALVKSSLNKLMQDGRPKIIIIQSDHGMHPNELSLPRKNYQMEFPNLTAIYYYDQDYSALPETLSAVNTFRLVFNKLFGMNLPLLEDRLYTSTLRAPYNFKDVTAWYLEKPRRGN